MVDLSLADQIQQYGNCLIMYKGKPHKVRQIANQVKLLDLITQREKLVDFKLADFTPPFLRLGFVNIDENAVFVSRKPVRMFLVGVHAHNTVISGCSGAAFPNPLKDSISKVSQFDSVEVANMLMGHYPTLLSALKRAGTFGGCVAFDKQFAVDVERNIYYKGKSVGYTSSRGEITWSKGLEYLSLLLDGAYEKATRTFEQEAA